MHIIGFNLSVNFSTVAILTPYTVTGVVTNIQKKPVTGVRVEAINLLTNKRIFSITNSAGIYLWEGLKKGNYEIRINNQQSEPSILEINENYETFFELNLIDK